MNTPDKPTPPTESPFKGKTGIRRIANALTYSLQGFRSAFVHEEAFRQEVLLAAVAIPIAFALDVSRAERALLVASVLLILVVELLNSAVEAVVDRVSLENHHLAKRAKDIGSAAVLMSICLALSTWLLVLTG